VIEVIVKVRALADDLTSPHNDATYLRIRRRQPQRRTR
jgi:hypothetical protein